MQPAVAIAADFRSPRSFGGRVARRRLGACQNFIGHSSYVNVSPPFLASPDESPRVPISIPRPSDKRCARGQLGACVAFARAFPPRAFPLPGGSFLPFG